MIFSHMTFPMYVDQDFSSTWSSSLFLSIIVIGVKHTTHITYVRNESVWPLCWSPRAHNPLPPPGRRASKLTTWLGTRHLGADDLGGQRAEVRAHSPLPPPGGHASKLTTWVGTRHLGADDLGGQQAMLTISSPLLGNALRS